MTTEKFAAIWHDESSDVCVGYGITAKLAYDDMVSCYVDTIINYTEVKFYSLLDIKVQITIA